MSVALAPAADREDEPSGNSFYAAMARTATRSLALYFSRPVRLFRPSKVSGWQILKGLATHHGQTLSPKYITWLIKEQGWAVIPKHFLPPMAVNLVLGSVLWETYAEASSRLEHHISNPLLLSAASGALAGGAQAVIAAPAENVRFVLEGGSVATGWSDAWKEVFRSTASRKPSQTKADELHEARQVRQWMKEVGEMAGRGWDGWGWGCAKDICGFAVFFSIFELTRRVAIHAKTLTESYLYAQDGRSKGQTLKDHTPRLVHAITLVSGGAAAGLAYELTCRPWDIARKTVHIERVTCGQEHSLTTILLRKVRNEGFHSFFVNPSPITHSDDATLPSYRRRLHSAARTLARVGPWGIGFLAWEAFGPGIS
ncbi:hypothetical protein K474DRAFT_1610961 [Panus rudis PR-1116 ss-1]|nr:hypothetical protein K474DRAFT_1610961 [Panus rudis PR-1116 ss-1]